MKLEMPLIRRTLSVGALVWLLLLVGCLPILNSETTQSPRRVVAIGDVHGDFEGLTRILRETALIDKNNHWIGGNTVLVQTGDFLDNGKDVKKVMDLLMDLQREAKNQGGEVIVLLGDHEMMNIGRLIANASPEAMDAFCLSESTDARTEYLKAIGPYGVYGKWLRALPVAARVGDTLFFHGGISPEASSMSIRTLNRTARREIEELDESWHFQKENEAVSKNTRFEELSKEGLLFGDTGPLRFQGWATWKEGALKEYLPTYLDKQKAKRVVSGHTPRQRDLISSRFDDRIFLLNSKMASTNFETGRPSALEIEWDHISAFYQSKRELLVESLSYAAKTTAPAHGWSKRIWLDPEGEPLPFTNNEEVIEFLRTAEVVGEFEIPVGITKPKKLLLQKGDVKAHAVFRYYHKIGSEKHIAKVSSESRNFMDSYSNEAAAYELSIILGMGTLPPTVLRTVGGVSGSLQLWVEGTMTDRDRITKRLNPPNIHQWKRQFWDIEVFDNLVNNIDRNHGNILIDNKWRIWMIDHTRSFAKDRELPDILGITRCSRQLWNGLQQMDQDLVKARLKQYLPSDEVSAFFARYKRINSHLRRLMERHGPDKVLFDHKIYLGA